ncbi:MAG: FecR domain-containing protein [Candidatus Eiseniibacteriota bacterium]
MVTRPEVGAHSEALRASLSRIPRRPAPSEFRARLRSQFVQDAIPRPPQRGTWPLVASGAVAAAAALLVVWFVNRGPQWELSAVTGTGTAQIDRRPVPLDAPAALARRLRPGAEVVLPPDAQLDLVLPGSVMMQIVGGSRAVVPGRAGRWFARSITVSLTSGEIRVATGPRFAGTRLTVVTPEAHAVVSGTALAVLRDADASCVCVFAGRVAMIGGGVTDTVRAGFRRSVFRSGSPPSLEPIRPMEAMKLGMLRDVAARELGRPGAASDPATHP